MEKPRFVFTTESFSPMCPQHTNHANILIGLQQHISGNEKKANFLHRKSEQT